MSRWLAYGVLALAVAGCVKREPLPPVTGSTQQGAALSLKLPFYREGGTYDLAFDRGKVVLLDVWATWCEPCKDALPIYQDLAKEYGSRGFRVYAINVDEDPRQIDTFLQTLKLTLPILVDKNAEVAERDLKVRVLPTSFLIDKRGNIRQVHEAFAPEFLARYQTEIEQLLAEP
jgi:cytochrome c biogenesis protein CcmG, thiol:disulfide interchange protein DsbE